MLTRHLVLLILSIGLIPPAEGAAFILETSARVRIVPGVEIERVETDAAKAPGLDSDAPNTSPGLRISTPLGYALSVTFVSTDPSTGMETMPWPADVAASADEEYLVDMTGIPGSCRLTISYE